MALYITEKEVGELLKMDDALAAVESVFKLQASGEATNEPRRRVRSQGSTLMTMSGAVSNLKLPGGVEFKGLLGLKSYTVSRTGARFYVSLFDAVTGELLAFIEADKLGQMRTGAASGVATKYLARENAKTVGVYGTGWQATSQLAAVCAVRPIELVKVYSRKPENRERFCQQMAVELGIADIQQVETPEAAADTEIVITITSSREPVVLGEWLKPGVHINAAGGNSILRREVDDKAIQRADFIAADSLDQAKLESGEFVTAVEKGLLTWERVKELRYVVSGQMRGRENSEQITLFKSLGLAIEDVAAAAVVYQKAKEQQAGKEI
ncbi:MAG: ornithine cyclodeaminase family protein [Acidobacteriota bacterium]|nr:ornithine cyclodeaminase family protein [Acidobacteriota bacterium]